MAFEEEVMLRPSIAATSQGDPEGGGVNPPKFPCEFP